ncbi:MAG TPA: CBS domain-containing protein [Micromonosporaceae bacterium]
MRAIYVANRDPEDRSGQTARRPVSEAMSSPVYTVPADLLLGDALAAMVRSGRRHLVAVDDAGRCVGVLADRAVAAAWAHDHTALTCRPVAAVLDDRPPLLPARARVVDAARMMRAGHIDAVIVVDDDRRPVGILTGSDLVALLAR